MTNSLQSHELLGLSQSLLKFMSIELVILSNHSSSAPPALQSFPSSGSFPMDQLFASGDQSTGASATALVLPMNIQGWFPLWLTSLISLQSKELSRVFSSTTVWKHQFFGAQPSHQESYDRPRQCVKKQRHHFANKVKIMLFPVVMYGCERWT